MSKRTAIVDEIARALSVDAGDEHPMYWINQADEILKALEGSGYVVLKRWELEEIAQRIAGCTTATIGNSLMETPRKSEHVPTLIELSMGHFKTIEQDLRGLIPGEK
jgi:hypothetical protein